MTEDQLELMRDKHTLWSRGAREGNMDLRDYNRRCAEALGQLLAEHSACHCGAAQTQNSPPLPLKEGRAKDAALREER